MVASSELILFEESLHPPLHLPKVSELALPDHERGPFQFAELPEHALVALLISLDLARPVIRVRLRWPVAAHAAVPVPPASMHEDGLGV